MSKSVKVAKTKTLTVSNGQLLADLDMSNYNGVCITVKPVPGTGAGTVKVLGSVNGTDFYAIKDDAGAAITGSIVAGVGCRISLTKIYDPIVRVTADISAGAGVYNFDAFCKEN